MVELQDCSIIKGHRGKAEQEIAFLGGKSKLNFPQSKHNKLPSLAVDVQPYPYYEGDLKRWFKFAGVVMAVAELEGVKLRWGGDFNMNGDYSDQTFIDLFHWELYG